jgi:pimeloyl-ACP methyl ester carboxylesterase
MAGDSETGGGPLVVGGYSWGALAAARRIRDSGRVRRAILVAPPPALLDRAELEAWGQPMLVIAGDRDSYVPIDELAGRLEGLERVELVVLEGVDHFFMSGLAELGRSVRRWLDR